MRRIPLALSAFCLLAGAQIGAAHASATSGELWINVTCLSDSGCNASDVPGGTPDATFSPGVIDYQSLIGGYTVGGFLNNPTFANESPAFISAGAGSADLNNTFIQITGTVGLNEGNNSFVVGHDDGVVLTIAGIGTVVDEPGPTGFDSTPFNVTAPSTGNYAFTLDYDECCGPPADLLWSINNVTVSSAPEPVSMAILSPALLGVAFVRRYRRRS
jgi:hypothetical protein